MAAIVTPADQDVDDPGNLADTAVAPFVPPLSRLHRVLCPRQVLGVRTALLAGRTLGVPFPQPDKRVIALAEIDGCYTDGLLVASGCSVGHRTLRVMDFGKIAATFFDTKRGKAVRIWPRPEVRDAACTYARSSPSRWHAQREGYARMPEAELLACRPVDVAESLVRELLEAWEGRVMCAGCGEEILHRRQMMVDGVAWCRGCAGDGYFAEC
jgi:formylmethanofuran dehydrogenase subunit E